MLHEYYSKNKLDHSKMCCLNGFRGVLHSCQYRTAQFVEKSNCDISINCQANCDCDNIIIIIINIIIIIIMCKSNILKISNNMVII